MPRTARLRALPADGPPAPAPVTLRAPFPTHRSRGDSR